MQLFDDIPREDQRTARFNEPEFAYLNISARLEMAKVRDLLEIWFANYPSAHQHTLREDFRNEDKHAGAFFELFIHELLLKLKCQVNQVHPTVADKATSPDFLVTTPLGKQFYLEATIMKDKTHNPYLNELCDIIDQLHSPAFFIDMTVVKPPTTTFSSKRVRIFLQQYLATLDGKAIYHLQQQQNRSKLPQWVYEQDQMKIIFHPFPKDKPDVRTLGKLSYGMWTGDNGRGLKRKINEKTGNKYGELQSPYIIAINNMGFSSDETDRMNALFGTEQLLITEEINDFTGFQSIRKKDGIWTSPQIPSNTRVSAILFVKHVTPYSFSRSHICLYHNPWATHPAQDCLNQLPQAIPSQGEMIFQDGNSLMELFELPYIWPED